MPSERYQVPGSSHRRTFSVTTLERWYYDYKHGGLDALKPQRRSDTRRCCNPTPEQKKLLLDVRREYPSATRGHRWRRQHRVAVIYRIDEDAVIVAAIFSKKTRANPTQWIETSQARLRRYNQRIAEED